MYIFFKFRIHPFVIELARLIRKYHLQGYSDSIDIQFSSSNGKVAKQLQYELTMALEENHFSDVSHYKQQSSSPFELTFYTALLLENIRILINRGDSVPLYGLSYGIVTDTVSLLPYVGTWDLADYDGIDRLIGSNGKISIFPHSFYSPKISSFKIDC